jgi:signal transduction histidine kinase
VLDQPQMTDPSTPRHPAPLPGAQDTPMPARTARHSDQAAVSPSEAPFEALREMVRLQRAELPPRDRLLRALALAEKLLPSAQRLRLFMPTGPTTRTFEVLESGQISSDAVNTLGYGAAADREVLHGRRAISQPHATIIPVPARWTGLPAILVVDWRAHTKRGQSEVLLSLVAEQFAALLDIMAREQHEKQLAAALEQQSQTFDTFISMTAHELRSPLTSIKGYAQLLVRQAQRSGLPATTLHSAEAIVEQGSRLAGMIEQLYDAARLRRGKLEIHRAPTDLVPLLREQAKQWPTTFPHHAVQLTITASSLAGNWDAQRVTQVIQNLVENAARFSPEEASIAVEVGRQGDEAAVCVRDEGVGIPQQDQPHIFEYMYRSPEAEARHLTGLGLGLFVSSQLAERMGGHVQLRRSPLGPRGGSEFCFTLPLAS